VSGTCLTCEHGALRDPVDGERDKLLRAMVRQGLINCTRTAAKAGFFKPSHTCNTWAPAAPETVEKRKAWMLKHQKQ
jgi:hypothetical protein